ncbi:MAG: pseudouridine synthase [Ignavibacteria bacterium]|jgi:pseudouridine synthase
MMRLNKFLAECGIASRRKSEEYITSGRVSVNKKIITDLAFTVNPESDNVSVDGEKIKSENKVYFLLNKPKGFVSTTKDEKKRKSVVDLINTRAKIFPVGRLDFNTTGVLLLTNDGEFSNILTHPRNNIPREYSVFLDKDLSAEHKERLIKGIILEGRKSNFKSIELLKKGNLKSVKVICFEGRNHFVKKMFSSFGYTVKELNRTRFGDFNTGKLSIGEYRQLNKVETNSILSRN